MTSETIVGRDRERRELQRALEDALEARGRLILLSGEPGIGKTSLADSISAAGRGAGASVLWGRCWEGGGAPAFWPWTQVLRSYVRGIDAATLASQLAGRAAHVAQIVPEVMGVLEGGDGAHGDPEGARFALFDSVSSFMADVSRVTPLVIVLDDLHAADEPSLLLLQFLARSIRDAAILLVGTYREHEARLNPARMKALASLGREGTILPLGGLDVSDVARLIDRAGGGDAAPSVIEAVFHASEGNPFFVDEIVRLLLAEGRLGASAPRIRIPDGVREAIEQRLALLDAGTQHLLSVAAVLGRDFDAETLARLAGTTREDVVARLDPAVGAGVVVDTLTALGRYAFAHALFRETIYDNLPAVERVARHRDAAVALESIAGGDDDRLTELAHHWFEAARAGDVEPAVRYATRAARRAIEQLAYEEAVEHYMRALEAMDVVADTPAADRGQATLGLADALWRAGRLADSRDAFMRASAIARHAGDGELMAHAVLGYGGTHLGGTWTRPWALDMTFIATLEETLALLGPKDTPSRARVLAYLGASLHFTMDYEKGRAFAEEAVQIAKSAGDPPTLAFCLTARHLAIWGPDTPRERVSIATDVLRLAAEQKNPELTLQMLMWRSAAYVELGRLEDAHADIEVYIRTAAALKRPQFDAYAALLRAAELQTEGKLEESIAESEAAYMYGKRVDDDTLAGSAAVQMMSTRFIQGRTADVSYLRDDYVDKLYGWSLGVHTQLYDDVTLRVRAAEWMKNGAFNFPRNAFWLIGGTSMALAAYRLNDPEMARVVERELEPYRESHAYSGRSAITRWGPLSRYLGIVATVQRAYDRADDYFRHALAESRRCGSPVFIAAACYGYGSMLRLRGAPGDAERAESLLGESRAIAREIGMGEIPLTDDDDRPPPSAAMLRSGDYWTLRFEGMETRLRDSKGLSYLAMLLSSPNREIHVLELTGAGEVAPALARDAGAALDEQAKAELKARIAALQVERDDALAFGDDAAAERAESEIDQITRHVAASVGLRGRDRKLDSASERARVAVTKALRSALDRITDAHPALGAHLTAAVRTGAFCAYEATSPASVWHVDFGS